MVVDVKTYHVQADTHLKRTQQRHNDAAAHIQKTTRADYTENKLISANEEFVTFAVAIEGALGTEAKKFVSRLAKAQRTLDNQDNYHCELPEQAADLYAGDLFTSLGHVRACAALHQMQKWVQHYLTLDSPDQAGHRSHALSTFGVRLERHRGNNFDTQMRLARYQRYHARRR